MKTLTATQALNRSAEGKAEHESPASKEAVRQIDDAINDCRTLYMHPLISQRTRKEYEEMWNGLKEKGDVEKIRENITYLRQTISEAESYRQSFERELRDAVKNKWINEASAKKWRDRFDDPNLLEWTRKEWITGNDEQGFSTLLKNWKKVAEEQEEVEKIAKKKSLTTKDIPELETIFEKDAFLALHYRERKDAVKKARALIIGHEKQQTVLLRSVEKELQQVAQQGALHPAKIGKWMKLVITQEDPQQFVQSVLHPFMQNWSEVRGEFDRVNSAMDDAGIPRGFRPVKEMDFLLMDYKKRTAYCALAWLRLEDAEEQDKHLAALKLRIRHNIDTEDWDGATTELNEALKIDPANRELRSMQTYIDCHARDAAIEQKESPNPYELNAKLMTLTSQLPGEVRGLYVTCMEKGPAYFNRLLQVMYNRVWFYEVARIDAQKERQLLDKVRGQPGSSIMDMQSIGQDGALNAIANHADEHAGRNAPNLNANEAWGYLATLIPPIPFALHNMIVKNLHYPMKSTLRELHAMGYSFSAAGHPIPKSATAQQAVQTN